MVSVRAVRDLNETLRVGGRGCDYVSMICSSMPRVGNILSARRDQVSWFRSHAWGCDVWLLFSRPTVFFPLSDFRRPSHGQTSRRQTPWRQAGVVESRTSRPGTAREWLPKWGQAFLSCCSGLVFPSSHYPRLSGFIPVFGVQQSRAASSTVVIPQRQCHVSANHRQRDWPSRYRQCSRTGAVRPTQPRASSSK